MKKRSAAEEKRLATVYRRRALDLPTSRMVMEVGRLGYEGEGLRLTFSIGCPYDVHIEVQLSRADAESLIDQLRSNLDDPRQDNLVKGTPA